MINRNNFMGLDGFVWWFGIIENRKDPLQTGRCQVRIFGWHTDDKNLVPTSDLPWAHPVMPLSTNTATGPAAKEGDMVFGFFLDSDDAQFPVMLGIVPGIPDIKQNTSKGFSDQRNFFDLLDSPKKPVSKVYTTNGKGVFIVEGSAKRYPVNINESTTSRLVRNENINQTIVQERKANRVLNVPTAAGLKISTGSFIGTLGSFSSVLGGLGNLDSLASSAVSFSGLASSTSLSSITSSLSSIGIQNLSEISGINLDYATPGINPYEPLSTASNLFQQDVTSLSKSALSNFANSAIKSNIPGVIPTNSLLSIANDPSSYLASFASSIINSGVDSSFSLNDLSSLVPGVPSLKTLSSLSRSIINSGVDPTISLVDLASSDSPFSSIALSIIGTGVDQTSTLEKLFSIQSDSIDDIDEQSFDSLASSIGSTWSEPQTKYNAKYPYNHVFESESGHVLEVDDTPGAERVQTTHRSGTFEEIHPDGTKVTKVVKNNYEIIMSDNNVLIMGKCNITINGDGNILVKGDTNIKVDGDMTTQVSGNYTLASAGAMRFVSPRIDLN